MQTHGASRLVHNVALIGLAWVVPCAALAQSDADVGAAVGECRRVQRTLERLSCYDRAFPPDGAAGAAVPQPSSAPVRDASAELQSEPSAAQSRDPRSAAPAERAPVSANRARIVEVTMPSLSTTVLVAADGRVFTRQNTTVVVRWPSTPFDVNIETSRLGNSTFLIHPSNGERVRVVVRDESGAQ
jgi:hypothetical protein